MTAAPDVLCLSPDTPLREGLRVMLARGVHAAPVVDDQGGVIGLLSQTDLLSLAAGDSASADLARLQYVAGEPRDAPPLTLRGAVRAALPRGAPLAAVPPAAPLPEAAALMLARGLHTLPVVDVPGDSAEVAEHAADAESPPRLLGVVSRTDILRAVLAAADREQDEDAFL